MTKCPSLEKEEAPSNLPERSNELIPLRLLFASTFQVAAAAADVVACCKPHYSQVAINCNSTQSTLSLSTSTCRWLFSWLFVLCAHK